jgi:hypothetical protein
MSPQELQVGIAKSNKWQNRMDAARANHTKKQSLLTRMGTTHCKPTNLQHRSTHTLPPHTSSSPYTPFLLTWMRTAHCKSHIFTTQKHKYTHCHHKQCRHHTHRGLNHTLIVDVDAHGTLQNPHIHNTAHTHSVATARIVVVTTHPHH